MATSGLLRSDQQSWIITGFFYSQVSPKYFGCGTSEVLFSTPLEGWQTVDPASQPLVLVNSFIDTHTPTHLLSPKAAFALP